MTDFQSGTLSFEGGKEMEKALKQIDEKLRNKIGRKAVRQAIKPVHAQIQGAAPVDRGALKQGITIKTRKRKGEMSASVVATDKFWTPRKPRTPRNPNVTPSSGKKRKVRELFYAKFIEFGTKHQAARPFMRPAFDAGREGMLSKVSAELRQGIDQAAKTAPKGKTVKP